MPSHAIANVEQYRHRSSYTTANTLAHSTNTHELEFLATIQNIQFNFNNMVTLIKSDLI